MRNILILVTVCLTSVLAQQPYYIQQCQRDDPDVDECLKSSGNILAKYLRTGVPELDILEVEPVIVDEISIALGGGPDGYRAVFSNIQAYGVGNLTLANLRSDIETNQYQLTFDIPKIKVKAKYRSSGVLLLIRASGHGDYWGEYDGVKAKVYFKATPHSGEDGLTYLVIDQAKMDFSVRDISMGVQNIANSNAIIEAALNLFINSNGQELLKEMKPQLRGKLTLVLHNFMDKIFSKIPLEQWLD